MDNNNDGPVGVRDYPPGCIPAPRRSQNSRMGATRVDAREEELGESPLVTLPADFDTLDARAQFLERRRIYELLRQHYESKKERDYGEVLHYSGEGGNDYKGEKRQVEDQKQGCGNEAMMNSYFMKKPVRVIRGHDVQTTKGWNKIYSYDGLYTVFYAKPEVGASGHKVYKFKLRRLPNQPDLKIKTVHFNGAQLS